ncbi:MAG: mercuric reductase [Chloroflexota bacterium]|nr:mercuric reductase [Chloroflexota bacterium]
MAEITNFDVVIIGAGQAGGPLATAIAGAGRTTALIEREHVGGTCINEGCTPTKTMVASARVAYLARRAGDYGVLVGEPTIDERRIRQRKRDIVTSFREGSETSLTGVDRLELIKGEAYFTGPKSLRVRMSNGKEREISATDTIFINSGARPGMPPLEGLSSVPALTSTSIMELDEVPAHLLVLGGGYIGLEFAQMFRRFGSRVTVVQRGSQLLGREDSDVAEEVATILRQDGIELLLKTEAIGVRHTKDGNIELHLKAADGEHIRTGSHLLVALGRTPNTDRLDLGAAGVLMDKHGYIPVNDRLETNVPGIYALGDVNGGPAFTHISYDDFRIAKRNLLEGGDASTRDRLVPYTVFIDPQLGRIGLSENEARAKGKKVKVAKMPMSNVARALEVDESRGFMKALVDAESGKILGAAVLGIEGGEIMAMLQIAMMGGLHYSKLRDGVFAHPTLAESLNNLFSTIDG